MTALDQGSYAQALAAFGRSVRPAAILAISAHWEEPGIRIASASQPELIYDFGGFPRALYQLKYRAPGSPDLARDVALAFRAKGFDAELDDQRGWDHGIWVPLRLMFPEAKIPVVAVSLPMGWTPEELYRVGIALAQFRKQGILVLGSGGIVHNLKLLNWREKHAPVDAWAKEFETWVAGKIAGYDLPSLFTYETMAPHAARAVPTPEHFTPLFPVLGAAARYSAVKPIFEAIEHANVSMYTFQLVD